MRMLLTLAALVAGVLLYASTYGLALGWASFTPVYYWNYSGEFTHTIEVNAVSNSIKIDLSGKLSQGRLTVWITRAGEQIYSPKTFSDSFSHYIYRRFPTGSYVVHFKLEDTRGEVSYNWLSIRWQSADFQR